MLPLSDQVYISSIVASIAERDLLLPGNNCSLSREKMRTILLDFYLKLGLYQHIFFCAFFYLEKFLSISPKPQFSDETTVVGCLALARKYQMGKPTRLKNWKSKLEL